MNSSRQGERINTEFVTVLVPTKKAMPIRTVGDIIEAFLIEKIAGKL